MPAKKENKHNAVKDTFGNRVRLRACGILLQDERILLVKHRIDDYDLWSPPGGGIEFGEPIGECLAREFIEETGLKMKVGKFLFITEHLDLPLHAVEIFYQVHTDQLNVRLGREPEVLNDNILRDIGFLSGDDMQRIPPQELHSVLRSCTNPIQLLDKQGHLKYGNRGL